MMFRESENKLAGGDLLAKQTADGQGICTSIKQGSRPSRGVRKSTSYVKSAWRCGVSSVGYIMGATWEHSWARRAHQCGSLETAVLSCADSESKASACEITNIDCKPEF